jgi:uncharacterized protein YunC (DUF1805 family)
MEGVVKEANFAAGKLGLRPGLKGRDALELL